MIIPDDDRCQEVIEVLMRCNDLNEWEQEFVESNIDRTHFSTAQKEVIAQLLKKYDI